LFICEVTVAGKGSRKATDPSDRLDLSPPRLAASTCVLAAAAIELARAAMAPGAAVAHARSGSHRARPRGGGACSTSEYRNRGISEMRDARVHMSGDLTVRNGWSWDGMAQKTKKFRSMAHRYERSF
jgi:hypothetical protein